MKTTNTTRFHGQSNLSAIRFSAHIVARITLVGALALSVVGCSDFRRAIGEEKSSPDEFEVVVRPPLSLPPGFADRPEDIIEAEKLSNSLDAQAQAQAALGSSSGTRLTGYDQLFDFSSVPTDIRERVDQETLGIQFERRLPIQVLFGGLPDVGPVLDKMAEDQRLRRNRRDGLVPGDGDIIARDAQTQETVIIKQ